MTNADRSPEALAVRASVRSSRRTALLAAVGAGLLVVGAAGFALAASPSPAVSGANGAPSATLAPGPSGSPDAAGRGRGLLGGRWGIGPAVGGLLPGRPFGAIHITAIDGSKLSLATDDGWQRTIDASGATITRAGESIGVGDLQVGDEIRFSQTHAADGSWTVNRVEVVLPTIAGEVTAVGSDTITVKRFDGTTATVHVSGDTTYVARGKSNAGLSDVTVGSYVIAQGTARDDGSLDALRVAVGQPTTIEGGRGRLFPFRPHGPKAGNGTSPSPSSSTSGA